MWRSRISSASRRQSGAPRSIRDKITTQPYSAGVGAGGVGGASAGGVGVPAAGLAAFFSTMATAMIEPS